MCFGRERDGEGGESEREKRKAACAVGRRATALRFARGDLRGGVPILWSAAEDVGLLARLVR